MWVCEPLGLAVNLKVKLESGVFSQWDDNQVWVGTLSYLKNGDLSKPDLHNISLWKCIMAWIKEISEDLREEKKKQAAVALLLLNRLEKITKPSLKSLESTNPRPDRLYTNGGNSRPLLPFPGVADQQKTLQDQGVYWSARSKRTPG